MFRHRHQLLRRPRAPSESLGLFCNYSHRVCMQTRLDGFEYCLKHILEDKTSPYKQCSYTSAKTNRRCTNATLKTDRKEGYCFEHSRKSCLLRQQASRKRRPKETAESLLAELNHYNENKPNLSDDGKRRRLTESLASKILDYGSSSDDSDSELPLVEQAWRGDGESDAESIDSEQEDPLKHAGIYTAEEVTLIMRDKLIRLQSLYIEQFKRLQHILKEKRRKYLHTTKLDKDNQGLQISKGGLAAQGKLANLTALKRYHQRHGKEALLQRQSKERRVAVSEGTNYRPTPFPKCSYTCGGSRCSMVAIPLTKFCSKHVVEDRHQVLFAACGFAQGDCGKAVAAFDPSPLCDLHRPLEDPAPVSLNPEAEGAGEQDMDILSAETSLEASVQSELSAVDESGLHLLAAQSSIMSAVPTASDALSASSDTLSATLDEPYMSSSDVPASGGDAPETSRDIPLSMELGSYEATSDPGQQQEGQSQPMEQEDPVELNVTDSTLAVDSPTISHPSGLTEDSNQEVSKSSDTPCVPDEATQLIQSGSTQSVASDHTDNPRANV